MHILLTLLSVLGWIALAFLCLVLAVIFTPARLVLELRYDTFTAKLKVLCFTFSIYPRKKEKHADQKREPRQEQQTQGMEKNLQSDKQKKQVAADAHTKSEKTASQKKNTLPTLRELAQLCSTAGALMRALLHSVHVRDVTAVWPVHYEDAAETAIRFGRMQAYLGSALGVLQNFIDIQLKQMDIIPDFTGEHKYRRYFYCKIQATPFIIGVTGIWALVKLRSMHAKGGLAS